ncbi:MAG: NAD-binding protein, partial [Melioribacteraceae bacterium]|nr:NAD-binding protein [Melioribacteraceae bacterium]
SFILAKTGMDNGFLSGSNYQMFLAVSILSMAATPFIISKSPALLDKLFMLNSFKKFGKTIDPEANPEHKKLSDHIVIIGFGLNGSNIAHAANKADIPYSIIEANPDTVKRETEKGEPIIFGDASNEEVLKYAGVQRARVVVVAINDATLTRRITTQIKELAENVYLIVRTRYVNEMQDLYKLGADEVIPEEFETSLEIFTRVLTKYLVPRVEIEEFVTDFRSHSYDMLRNFSESNYKSTNLKLHFPDLEIVSFEVNKSCEIVNQTLAESDFRNRFNASVIAVESNSVVTTSPSADYKISVGDLIFILTNHNNIPKLKSVFIKNGK